MAPLNLEEEFFSKSPSMKPSSLKSGTASEITVTERGSL